MSAHRPRELNRVFHETGYVGLILREHVKERKRKFLVISKPKHPLPPEAVPGLVDAMAAWASKYTESGKIEAIWSFAGLGGGGGIANVDSLEELDAIMAEFPFGPFSEIEVLPLTDLNESLLRLKQAALAMAQAMPKA